MSVMDIHSAGYQRSRSHCSSPGQGNLTSVFCPAAQKSSAMNGYFTMTKFIAAMAIWPSLGYCVTASALVDTVAIVSTAEEYVQAFGAGVEHIVFNDHLDLRNVTVESMRSARTAVSTSSLRVRYPSSDLSAHRAGLRKNCFNGY